MWDDNCVPLPKSTVGHVVKNLERQTLYNVHAHRVLEIQRVFYPGCIYEKDELFLRIRPTVMHQRLFISSTLSDMSLLVTHYQFIKMFIIFFWCGHVSIQHVTCCMSHFCLPSWLNQVGLLLETDWHRLLVNENSNLLKTYVIVKANVLIGRG